MAKDSTQYHPRHQWLNQAAIDYHTELAKPDGARDAERLDSLRSEIWTGLSDYYRFLTVTKQGFGIHNPEDIVHSLLVSTMEVANKKGNPGWLESYKVSSGVPFLGYLAECATGKVGHLKRDTSPGSGRAQDETRKFNKEVERVKEEQPEVDLDKIRAGVFNSMGIGIEQIKNVQMLNSIHILSTEHPIGEGITIGDTIANPDGEGLSILDRTTLQMIGSERMPKRYRMIFDSMLEGSIEGLHDIDFGADLTLAEEVVLFSTAMKVVREHTTRVTAQRS